MRKAEPRRPPDPYPWSAAARTSERLGPDLVRGDFRLQELAACGRLEPARVASFLDGAGLADLGFSIYASSARLGELADPDLLSRVAEVIVLVHGSSSSRKAWRLLAPALCRDNALALVLVPDCHGYGETPFAAARPARQHLTLRAMAESVLGLCRLLGLVEVPTVLVGHSMGAMALLTLDDSDVDAQVARVLINPLYVEHDARVRNGMLALSLLTRATASIPPLRRALTHRVCRTGPSEQLLREDQDEMIALSLGVTPGVLAGVLEALARVQYKRGRQRRVALLCGVDDPWTRGPDLIERATRDLGIDPAHIHLLASGGHTPQIPMSTHPEWTARNIDEIGRVVQAMILTAHEPTSTPSMTATSVGTGTTL
ncbi:MAG: alpha/beta fold hydrolase [Deltaproteobacteria bacterium]|nr:alpha/beta fold hydrolase [Kofleriaceae bacterium]